MRSAFDERLAGPDIGQNNGLVSGGPCGQARHEMGNSRPGRQASSRRVGGHLNLQITPKVLRKPAVLFVNKLSIRIPGTPARVLP